jgi:CheY-like chemotaxis protein
VDDEQLVRNLLARVLKQTGYQVLEAEDGRSGVELYRANAPQIGCVLLDLTMPHLNGEEALREIRQIEPQAKVVLMSGYSEEEVSQRFVNQGPLEFLQKPFNLKEVLNLLKRILP